jgi:hypothetical protein
MSYDYSSESLADLIKRLEQALEDMDRAIEDIRGTRTDDTTQQEIDQ